LVQQTGQSSFDVQALVAAGFARQNDKIKVLGNGTADRKVISDGSCYFGFRKSSH
jgi:hypothetical protein